MRTFLAANIPDYIKNNILSLINMMKIGGGEVKWVNPENIHITIYFFGEVVEGNISVLSNELMGLKGITLPFKVTIKGVSAFPNPRRPRIIWCGIEDNNHVLKDLNNFVREAVNNNKLNVKLENREYKPHLTIGRVKGRYFDSLIKKIILSELKVFGSFVVDELSLYSSALTKKGPIYKEIERYSFKKSG